CRAPRHGLEFRGSPAGARAASPRDFALGVTPCRARTGTGTPMPAIRPCVPRKCSRVVRLLTGEIPCLCAVQGDVLHCIFHLQLCATSSPGRMSRSATTSMAMLLPAYLQKELWSFHIVPLGPLELLYHCSKKK